MGLQDVVVLESDAALKRFRVDTRLEGEDIAYLENVVTPGNDARSFMPAVSDPAASVK